MGKRPKIKPVAVDQSVPLIRAVIKLLHNFLNQFAYWGMPGEFWHDGMCFKENILFPKEESMSSLEPGTSIQYNTKRAIGAWA